MHCTHVQLGHSPQATQSVKEKQAHRNNLKGLWFVPLNAGNRIRRKMVYAHFLFSEELIHFSYMNIALIDRFYPHLTFNSHLRSLAKELGVFISSLRQNCEQSNYYVTCKKFNMLK